MAALDLPLTGSPISKANQMLGERLMQFQIDNMACSGCARSVTKAIHSVDTQAKVDIDLNLKRATVRSGADQSAVAAVLKEVGFPPRRAA